MMYIWLLLGVAAVILLAKYFNGRNAVWGGLTWGAIVGIIVAIFWAIRGNGFDWYLIAKIAIVGILLGFVAELLGMVPDRMNKKSRK